MNNGSEPILQLRNITVDFVGRILRAVCDVSLMYDKVRFWGLSVRAAAGKSTLAVPAILSVVSTPGPDHQRTGPLQGAGHTQIAGVGAA